MCNFSKELGSVISSMCNDGLSFRESIYFIKYYVSMVDSLSSVLQISSSIDYDKIISYLKLQTDLH